MGRGASAVRSPSTKRTFDFRAGVFAVLAAVILAQAYNFGSSSHNCMSINWGFYSVMLLFGLLLYPPFVFGTMLAGAFIFALGGYAARFVTFRTLPTLITLALASMVFFYLGFAITQPTLEGCLPL